MSTIVSGRKPRRASAERVQSAQCGTEVRDEAATPAAPPRRRGTAAGRAPAPCRQTEALFETGLDGDRLFGGGFAMRIASLAMVAAILAGCGAATTPAPAPTPTPVPTKSPSELTDLPTAPVISSDRPMRP